MPEKSKEWTLVCKLLGVSDCGFASAAYAMVTLTPAMALQLLRLRTAFDHVKCVAAEDGRAAYSINVWDCTASYYLKIVKPGYGGEGDDEDDEDDEDVTVSDWMIAGRGVEGQEPKDDNEDRFRSECDVCVITEADVYWSGTVRHTDVEFSTERLSWDDIRLIAEGQAPKLPTLNLRKN